MTVDKVELALGVADTVSLEQPVGEDGAQLDDFIEDEDAADPVQLTEEMDVANSLRAHRAAPQPGGAHPGAPLWLLRRGAPHAGGDRRGVQPDPGTDPSTGEAGAVPATAPSFGIREQDLI